MESEVSCCVARIVMLRASKCTQEPANVSICHGEGGGLMNKLAQVQADNNALSDTLDSPRVPLVDHPACKDDLIELYKSCHATKQVLLD